MQPAAHKAGTFVADTARPANEDVLVGVVGVFGALLLFFIAWQLGSSVPARFHEFTIGTAIYHHAQWASAGGLAAFAAFSFVAGIALFGVALRAALALPNPRRRTKWRIARAILAVPVVTMLMLTLSPADVDAAQDASALWSLGLGLTLCLAFAYDIPQLIRHATQALKARAPLLGVPVRTIANLRAGERARVRGVTVSPMGNTTVYVIDQITFIPFSLTDRTGSVQIDVDAQTLVESRTGQISAGQAIEVVGTVSGASDAYRGDVRLGSGPSRLYLLANGPPMHRRFLVAAMVELATAIGLGLGPLAFLATWSYLGWLALR